MSTCFFIGHRDAPETIFPYLARAIEFHITAYGVTEFVVGHYGAFDRMAARALADAKKRHPDVTLVLLLPYHPAECPVPLPPDFDTSFYPPGLETVPKPFAISRANRYMVDHCLFLIAYSEHPGNTAKLVAHAHRKESLHVQNLAEPETPRPHPHCPSWHHSPSGCHLGAQRGDTGPADQTARNLRPL